MQNGHRILIITIRNTELNILQAVSYAFWRLTQNETKLDQWSAHRIQSLRPPKSIITVTTNNTIDELLVPDGLSPDDITEKHNELVNRQERLDASTDAFCKANIYSFNKGLVPKIPRLRTPFPLFTMDTPPPAQLLRDPEFLEIIGSQAPEPQCLTSEDLYVSRVS